MNQEWSLDVLYKGFKTEEFLNDVKKVDEIIHTFDLFANSEKLKSYGSNSEIKEVLKEGISILEEITELEINLEYYCLLRQSVNTSDSEAISYSSILRKQFSNMKKPLTILKRYIAGIDTLDEVISQDKFLEEYRFMLQEFKKDSIYLLSEDVEDVISKYKINGILGWKNLYEYLISTVKVDYNKDVVTLPEIRNLAYSTDGNIRKSAYEAELLSYDKIQDSIAFALNNMKNQVIAETKLRGYKSPLDMTLKKANMKRETLDAMLKAIEEYLPKFHEYLKAKARLLGYQTGLPWYELFAPVGSVNKTYTVEEAKDYLLHLFGNFAPDLKDMVKRAFEEEWIDFFPRKGKVDGAFCCNLHTKKQSRILANFDGSFSDIVTLAHELGHAYHNQNIHSHRVLNSDYCMPVAETASTFNEAVLVNAVIKTAKDNEKLAFIENQLQDAAQIICDIYSRYLFETAVFENCEQKFLFPEELKQMMLEAQKKAYGDGLVQETLHPYMWVCKGHYYREDTNFYNFPYAFGGLFARGLYAKYQEEGEKFLTTYRELLYATTISSVEETAKIAGIDLTNPEFFRKGLQSFAEEIDEFITLCENK